MAYLLFEYCLKFQTFCKAVMGKCIFGIRNSKVSGKFLCFSIKFSENKKLKYQVCRNNEKPSKCAQTGQHCKMWSTGGVAVARFSNISAEVLGRRATRSFKIFSFLHFPPRVSLNRKIAFENLVIFVFILYVAIVG